MEQSWLRSSIPPLHGASREQALLHGSRVLQSASLQSLTLRFSPRGNAIPDTHLHVEGTVCTPDVQEGERWRSLAWVLGEAGTSGGFSWLHQAFLSQHLRQYHNCVPPWIATKDAGERVRGDQRQLLGREVLPQQCGDDAAERGEQDGVAGALQEPSWSVCPEGSTGGRYYVLRH